MRQILVLGAGKSASVLIDYLIFHSAQEQWHVHVADMDINLASAKTGKRANATAYGITGLEDPQVNNLIQLSNLVISLLPPPFHPLVARKCLDAGKHFLNASYMSPEVEAMREEVQQKKLVFICEMGLDPGIDHMSAMAVVDEINAQGGRINLFRSHCGGLVAPESDDNPWHYKISWNPRNIIMAGKDGAHYRTDGKDIHLGYASLFDPERTVDVEGYGKFAWYPNRDSLSYLATYGMEDVPTFVRTTLRHPEFCLGWKNIVALKLTDDSEVYDTNGMTISAFFQIHFDRFGFSDWLQEMLSQRFDSTREHLENLIKLMEKQAGGDLGKDDFMAVDASGSLKDMSIDQEKSKTASAMASQMQEANIALGQLFYLGLDSAELINRGQQTAAEILQWILERKLALKHGDKDMIVMLHEIGYALHGENHLIKCQLVVKGEDEVRTAMAKTVGLPLGIAAKLTLNGLISPGVRIPVSADIYEPVLAALEKEGIRFTHHSQPD